MKIIKLNDIETTEILFPIENNREIKIHEIKNGQFILDKIFYPDVKIKSVYENLIIDPIDETIMSLKNIKNDELITDEFRNFTKVEFDPVFFFIYNSENYYHFVYDTLPYLISYTEMKKKYPSLKILINYPNKQANKLYRFVIEFLEILNISIRDVIFVDPCVLYKKILISSSYTHGIDSNLPPHKEIFDLYAKIIKKINISDKKCHEKIYISRRTWMHDKKDNIGTDYTSRRKLSNETELVNLLSKKGYTEVFTELLTTVEKIKLFHNSSHVVGPIGGGLCNVLFSNQNLQLYPIISPTFLDINKRFLYSFSKVNTKLIEGAKHIEKTDFKKYMRVTTNFNKKTIIGEIINVENEIITINYCENKVAGWNNTNQYKQKTLHVSECKKLDEGLNSEWIIDLNIIDNLII